MLADAPRTLSDEEMRRYNDRNKKPLTTKEQVQIELRKMFG